MGWQIFLTISILCESFGRVLQRFLLRDKNSDPISVAVWFQLLTGILLLVFTLFWGFKLPENLSSLLPNLILMPIFYGLMSILIFKALELTEASIFTILFNARVIIIVLMAVIFLKDPFNLQQVLGLFLILASVVAVSFKRAQIKFKRGEIYSLLSGIFLACGTINDSIILRTFDAVTYSGLVFLATGIFIWVVNIKSTKKMLFLSKSKVMPKIALLCLIYGVGYLSYNLAYFSSNNAAKIAAIFPITAVLTVLISIFLLKERQHLLIKLAASIISFVGVLLVS